MITLYFINSRKIADFLLKRSLFLLVYVIVAGFLAVSCDEESSPYVLRDTLPPDQFIFIDTLKELAIRNYMVDPDKAERLLNTASRACDSVGLPEKKFQILLEKAEFYQYRKPDFLKSLKNLSEAVTIFIQHPGPYAEDPYIYINIGNFFYRVRYYEKSRSFYHLAVTISQKIALPHAEAIALQNIGLTFRQTGQIDSSFAYYTKIRHIQSEVGFLTLAQNYSYIAGYYLMAKNLNSAKLAVDSGFRMVDRFRAQKPSELGTVYPKLLVYSEEIESNLHYLHYQVDKESNLHDSAIHQFQSALSHARNIQSNAILSNLYLAMVCDPYTGPDDILEEALADSAIHYTRLANDPFKLQEMADTLSRHFSHTGNQPAYEKFASLNRYLTDSLTELKGSREIFESEVLITSAAAEQAIQRLNFEKAENLRSLKYYRMVLLFIFLIAILTAIALYFFLQQYKKLQHAYSNLAGRIRQSVQKEKSDKQESSKQVNDSFSGIINDLEQLMQVEKIYLNPDLTLNELATLLQTNKTYLSSILNQQFELNFNEYVNQFRIEEACRIILDPDLSKLSFDHILEKAGFHTKSTFYASFKKFTGMSPATFLKTVKRAPFRLQRSPDTIQKYLKS